MHMVYTIVSQKEKTKYAQLLHIKVYVKKFYLILTCVQLKVFLHSGVEKIVQTNFHKLLYRSLNIRI